MEVEGLEGACAVNAIAVRLHRHRCLAVDERNLHGAAGAIGVHAVDLDAVRARTAVVGDREVERRICGGGACKLDVARGGVRPFEALHEHAGRGHGLHIATPLLITDPAFAVLVVIPIRRRVGADEHVDRDREGIGGIHRAVVGGEHELLGTGGAGREAVIRRRGNGVGAVDGNLVAEVVVVRVLEDLGQVKPVGGTHRYRLRVGRLDAGLEHRRIVRLLDLQLHHVGIRRIDDAVVGGEHERVHAGLVEHDAVVLVGGDGLGVVDGDRVGERIAVVVGEHLRQIELIGLVRRNRSGHGVGEAVDDMGRSVHVERDVGKIGEDAGSRGALGHTRRVAEALGAVAASSAAGEPGHGHGAVADGVGLLRRPGRRDLHVDGVIQTAEVVLAVPMLGPIGGIA